MKYLEINKCNKKCVLGLCAENYKRLMRKKGPKLMEMHTVYITWKTQPCIDVPSPQIDIQVECNQNLIRIFFCRYKQADSKILCGKQSNEISPILKNKRLDKSYCSIFNTYCKATVFETVWY